MLSMRFKCKKYIKRGIGSFEERTSFDLILAFYTEHKP